jgi:nitroreductase
MNPPITPETTAAVDAAIASRRSIRAFLPTPVPRQTIEDILAVATRAPSGVNTQPWKVTVLTGAAKEELSRRVLAAHDANFANSAQGSTGADVGEYDYYPTEWVPPYIERRRKVGWDLYGLLGIAKGDKPRMHAQHGRNYRVFDAPVGMIFTIDRILRQGSWLDYGMFLENIMIAARGRGLDTCPQAAFIGFHKVIGEFLELPASQMVVCGMSLGWADESAPENRLITEREPVAAFTRFVE